METSYEIGEANELRARQKSLECKAIDADTLTACGCTDSEKCACGCGKAVCEDHGVQLFGMAGYFLPVCASLEFAAEELMEMEAA